MKKLFSAFAIGGVFGVGIAISGMINPAKVLNFFDFAGTWDPSLAFVMGGAVVVAFVGFRLIFGNRARPIFENSFALPTRRDIDGTLVGGSAVFGIGWGIAGFCPGGAVPALGLLNWETPIFLAAMIGGMIVARLMQARATTTNAPVG